MVKTISYFNCRGGASAVCKDTICCRDNGELGIYSVADGFNSASKSHIGARAVQKALADEMESLSDWYFTMPEAWIKTSVIEIIHDVLYNLTDGNESPYEYASTLMILILSRERRLYRWFHIGDGIIVKQDVQEKLCMVSHPHNGMTRQHTFSTADRRLSRYLRTGIGKLENTEKFLLLTDGAAAPFYEYNGLTTDGAMMLESGAERVLMALEQNRPADDHTMLCVQV